MSKKSDKFNTDLDTHSDLDTGDDKLKSLKEWERLNPAGGNKNGDSRESPRFCRMNEGVMDRISDENDDSLNEESAGVGLAAMIQLGEALISATSDALKSIKKRINDRIDVCLKAFNLRR